MDIKQFLRDSGIKKYAFARRIGVHPATLSRYLAGTLPISLEVQARIRQAIADLSPAPRVADESSVNPQLPS